MRHRAATLALAATVGLTVVKLAVGVASGSVGVLSEGIHSFLDVVSAALAYFTVREAGKPADEDHPFGHGKIETLSSLFESLLLLVAAGLIVHEGLAHVRSPHAIRHAGLAMGTIFLSLVVSWFVYRHNLAAARTAESSALRVNALHFLSDVVASLGILAGLVLLKITGWRIVDPIMAFAVATYIVATSLPQVMAAIRELSDTQLPPAERVRLAALIDRARADGKTIETHDLRTRRSGATRHLDFHLVVCGAMRVDEAHSICDQIEGRIKQEFPGASVNIHIEPCERSRPQCAGCGVGASPGGSVGAPPP